MPENDRLATSIFSGNFKVPFSQRTSQVEVPVVKTNHAGTRSKAGEPCDRPALLATLPMALNRDRTR